MTNECIVSVDHLNVVFGNFRAVKDVSFNVYRGEIFGFLGANGAGKTTTIRVLCGLLVPTSGNVVVDNIQSSAETIPNIKQIVGYMSQKFTLYDDLTIQENLEFTASLRQIPDKIFNEQKEKLLQFIGFTQNEKTVVKNVPSGIKQEIALVASILHNPKIVFLDEPTAGVAPVARAKFWELIKRLAADGKTIFVTTHYMDEAENCNRIALMRSGELIALDSPTKLKQTTYNKQMYSITPFDHISEKEVLKLRDNFSLFEPYGRHYHVIVNKNLPENTVISTIAQYCDVKSINPSLEDVFVKLVEGASR